MRCSATRRTRASLLRQPIGASRCTAGPGP